MTTLLQCPNCFAPLPPPGSRHTTCRFCGATSLMQGAHAPPPPPAPPMTPNELGAKALAMDLKRAQGVDVMRDEMAMKRLGTAWTKAEGELSHAARAEINLPFITATPAGPVHYQREVDRRMMLLMYEEAKKS